MTDDYHQLRIGFVLYIRAFISGTGLLYETVFGENRSASILTRLTMTLAQHRSLISAAVATSVSTKVHVVIDLLLLAEHAPLDEEPLL